MLSAMNHTWSCCSNAIARHPFAALHIHRCSRHFINLSQVESWCCTSLLHPRLSPRTPSPLSYYELSWRLLPLIWVRLTFIVLGVRFSNPSHFTFCNPYSFGGSALSFMRRAVILQFTSIYREFLQIYKALNYCQNRNGWINGV